MKHQWVCKSPPHKEKLVEKDGVRIAWHGPIPPNSRLKERIVMMPGSYVCEVCGYRQSSVGPPVSDWDGTVTPRCEDQVVKRVHET